MNELENELHRVHIEKLQSIADDYVEALFQLTAIELIAAEGDRDPAHRVSVLLRKSERQSH